MSKTDLKVIEGNLLLEPHDACGEFVSAEATATRLMGVIGLHISRKNDGIPFHQFFYIDTEEYGLDDYQSFSNISIKDVNKKKAELFGALGGTWVNISEKDALFLIKHYSRINIKQKLPLPEGIDEYSPILTADFIMTSDEKTALWGKICTSPRNDYELINYYIMRMVACDTESILRFTAPASVVKRIKVSNPGSLLKNEIIKSAENTGSEHSYSCVSLLDIDKNYQLVESEITLLGNMVTRFVSGNPLSISPWEASLIMNQPEYIIHSTIDLGKDNIESDASSIVREAINSLFSAVTESAYDFGLLYMVFRKNNDHVKKRVYRLDQDTLGVICMLESGEIVFAGNDPLQLETINQSLIAALNLREISIKELGRYKFPEPLLVRFIDTDFETFADFLEYIHGLQSD